MNHLSRGQKPPSLPTGTQRRWSSRRWGAAPHHHPSTEPWGSAGAGVEPPPLHKASLQTGSALEPRHFPRGNSSKRALPCKNTAALLPAGPPTLPPPAVTAGEGILQPSARSHCPWEQAAALTAAARPRCTVSSEPRPTAFPHLGRGKPQGREQSTQNSGVAQADSRASSFPPPHRVIPRCQAHWATTTSLLTEVSESLNHSPSPWSGGNEARGCFAGDSVYYSDVQQMSVRNYAALGRDNEAPSSGCFLKPLQMWSYSYAVAKRSSTSRNSFKMKWR